MRKTAKTQPADATPPAPLADHDRLPSERRVTIANALTRAAQGLTLSEKRLVMCAVSKLDSRHPATVGAAPVTRITAAEYAEHAKCGMNAAYEALKTAKDRLFERKISFYEPPTPRSKGKPVSVVMRWVGQAGHYHDGEGWVELHWWHGVLPYLTGLKKQFTTYQLQQASALRSIYSWRLLELISQFQASGWLEMSIEEFAHAMEANDKQKADFAKLRTRMIEPAVKELQDKDGWLISWKPLKAGRRVAALRFDFVRNPQGRLDLGEPNHAPEHPPFAALEGPGLGSASKPTSRAKPAAADPAPAALVPAAPDILETQPKGRRRPPAVWDETRAKLGRRITEEKSA